MITEIDYKKPKIHVFICCNERGPESSLKVSCSPTINSNNIVEVKKWVLENNLIRNVYITKTGCLGKCTSSGGVMLMFPQNKYYLGLKNSQEIIDIIKQNF